MAVAVVVTWVQSSEVGRRRWVFRARGCLKTAKQRGHWMEWSWTRSRCSLTFSLALAGKLGAVGRKGLLHLCDVSEAVAEAGVGFGRFERVALVVGAGDSAGGALGAAGFVVAVTVTAVIVVVVVVVAIVAV